DFNIRITNRFLAELLRLPFTFFSSRKTGDLIARLNDTERLQQAVTDVLGNIVVDGLVVAVGFFFVMFYSVPIAVALVLLLAVMGVSTRRFHHPIVKGQHRMMAAHSINKSGYVEVIQAVETIKSSNAEAHYARWMEETYARLQHEIFRLGKLGIAFSATVDLVGAAAVVGVLSWSSFLVLDESIGPGSLVALLQIAGMIVQSARNLATANVRFQEASVAFDRMFQLTSLEPEYNPNVEATKRSVRVVHGLTVEDLRFRYPGRDPLFEHVSFDCRCGDLLLLIGRTGSGKSTLLKILQRLLHPESGRIRVNGRDWLDYSMQSWRDAVGVVPQHVRLFSGTLLDNICLGRSLDPDELVERCNRFGLQHCFEGLPAGYATVVGEGGVGLSGGQRQLVGLARALVRPSRILLLDEPTAGMDDETAEFMRQLIDRIRCGKIVIVASHASTFRPHANCTYRM
ncbi:MAG: ATP-binding cassette domain-containing protein, partial [Rhodothermales bacterium]